MTKFDTELSITYAENEVKEQQLAKENTIIVAGGIIATVIIAFLSFFAYRRNLHLKHLASVNSQLKEAYDQLEETTAAKERIESELRIAREIQKCMLPHVFPKRQDVDIYAMMTPAREVGGDLYGYALIDDLLYFCVGDVSDKGVPATLYMAEVTRMFRTLVDSKIMPDMIATRMNHVLSEDNEQGMFVTMFICMYALKQHRLEYCNAGHNPPIIGNAEGQYAFLDMKETNAPIGLWPDLEFVGEEIDLPRGNMMLLYTDGLNEAENRQQEQYGEDRIIQLMTSHASQATRDMIEALMADADQFRTGAEQNDDLTMLAFRVTQH
jgi:serine phosphatase RsbU (regulator of sigma subunit)